MTMQVGLDCKTYHNTGTYGVPVWNEITTIIDTNLGLTKGKATGMSRASAWEQFLPTLKRGPLTWNMRRDPAVDDHDILKDAYLDDDILDIAFASGGIAVSGTRYFRADFYVFDFGNGEPLEGTATIDVALDLAVSANVPVFTTV